MGFPTRKDLDSISSASIYGTLTTSDSAQEFTMRGIFVGTGGDVSVKNNAGDTVVFKNIPDGTFLPVITNTVLTATTASDLVYFI